MSVSSGCLSSTVLRVRGRVVMQHRRGHARSRAQHGRRRRRASSRLARRTRCIALRRTRRSAAFDVRQAHGKAPQVNFHSAPPPADLKKREQQTKPTQPDESMNAAQRDERKSRLQARARALLVTEIQGLESLFRTTPKNAPDRPQLARRLAEDYVELERAAFRDKTEAEISATTRRKTNPRAAGQQQAERQPGRQDHDGRAQEGHRVLHR